MLVCRQQQDAHVDPKVNKMIIEVIAKKWGFSDCRGKKYPTLGMDIELLDDNKLTIGTKIYIQESIDLFDEDVSTKVSSLAHKVYKKLIQDTLHYQRSRHNIFIPLLKVFYGPLNDHNQILKLKLFFFVL